MTINHLKKRFFTGWGRLATGWGLSVTTWTVALIARIFVGPVAWVRSLWLCGLEGAIILLGVLGALWIGHIVLRLVQRS